MPTYDIDGQLMNAVYDADGTVSSAYDIDGNLLSELKVRLCAYNCGQWYIGGHDNIPAEYDETYYALQSGMISDIDADILLLEEYTAQFSKAGRTALSWLSQIYPYYHEQGNGTTTTVQQRAVYSKYPIANYTTHAFTDGSGYYFDTCTITVHGIPITVAVTHMHWNNRTYRVQEVGEILSVVASSDRFIVGGDFNLEDYYDTSGSDYTQTMKPFRDGGYNIANGAGFGFLTTYSDDPTGTYTGCLDNIVTSANITIDDVFVDTTKETDGLADKIDHMPLVADLILLGGGS